MKNKRGISLIVLIITIVVIIILAAAIILSLSKTNVIKNANEAVLKSDIANLKSELELYVSDKFVDTKGKYDRIQLNADQNTATYGDDIIEDKNNDGSSNIYDILISLKKSNWKDIVYIEEGKIVFKKNSLTDEQIQTIINSGIEVSGMPKITNILTDSTYTSINVTLSVNLAEEVEKYKYILNDGEIEETTELTKTYTGLTSGTSYILEVIMVLKDGTEISKKQMISTKDINGIIEYTLSETEWTKEDVIVTITYSEEIPEGYELQYKTSDNDGNIIQDWTKYIGEIIVTESMTIKTRLYNTVEDDEKATNSKSISKIDKTEPTASMTAENVGGKAEISVIVTASDSKSGISKIMYYYKKSTETGYTLAQTININEESEVENNFVITGLESQTTYKDALVIEEVEEDIIRNLSIYENGEIYLQSLSSMFPVVALEPKEDENILDMAAAPGGKTTQIVAISNGKSLVTACEKNKIRCDRLRYNLNKQGATGVNVLMQDARNLDNYFSFDKILLDAPCSGSGTLNLADINLERRISKELVERSVKTQFELLKKAIAVLKVGHEMIYSTCSILKEENEDNLNKILKNKNIEIVPIDEELFKDIPQLPTSIKGTICIMPCELYEGFFIAKLRKK